MGRRGRQSTRGYYGAKPDRDRKEKVEIKPFLGDSGLATKAQLRRVGDFIEEKIADMIPDAKTAHEKENANPKGTFETRSKARQTYELLLNSFVDLDLLPRTMPEGEIQPGKPIVTIWPRTDSYYQPYTRHQRAIPWHGAYPVRMRVPIATREAAREEKLLETIEGIDLGTWRLVFSNFMLGTVEEALVFAAGYCVRWWGMAQPTLEDREKSGRLIVALANGMGRAWADEWRAAEEKRKKRAKSARACTPKEVPAEPVEPATAPEKTEIA